MRNIFKQTKKQEKTKKQEQTDNVVYVDAPPEAREHNAKKRKEYVRKRITVFLSVIVVAFAAFFVIKALLNREYKGYSVLKTYDTSYENTANYIRFDGNLLKYTPDGISYINSNGETLWSSGVDMKMPMAVANGSYAVVADISGNAVFIFNTEGQVSSLTMPYTICDVDIADQGVIAVVLESDKTNYINIYDKAGNIICEMQTSIDMSGYPLDIAISDDGKKLFTSYLKVAGTKVENNLSAYNFGEVGQNSNVDRMVGGYIFDDQIVPKLDFVDNNTVVAFGTKQINIFGMKEKPGKKAEIEFDDEIQSVFYSSKYIGAIQKCDSEKTDHLYIATVYDLKGGKEFEKYIDFEYDYIYATKKEIIISGGSDCMIIRKNGTVKYDGKLSGKIRSIVPNGKTLEYIVVYDDFTEIIKLKRDSGRSGNANEDTATSLDAVR